MSRFAGKTVDQAFQMILHSLMQISKGAGFCEDRGMGWTMESEKAQSRDLIEEAFAAFPELRTMMPDHAAKIAEGALLGDVMSDEVSRARAHFRSQRQPAPAPEVTGENGFAVMEIAAVFQAIEPKLKEITSSANYCDEKGFGWSVHQENQVGRAMIAEAFAAHPRLADLMPARAAQLAAGMPIGDVLSYDELDAAKAVLDPPKPRRRTKG